MAGIIESDHRRFREIVKGHVRENLGKYITNGQFIGKEGKDYVRVPLPNINLPKFIYNDSDDDGIGQGDAGEGEYVDGGEAGNEHGELIYEADLSLEEIAEILGERLELEELKPKSMEDVEEEKDKYTSIRKTGPESLRHFKRTYKTALKRMISAGEYDPKNPVIVPIRQDKYYRSWRRTPNPNARALIIHARDISGSMEGDKVEIVRNTAWCADTWIRAQYKNKVHHVYLVHHANAWEVDREEFFRISSSGGGTVISSVFKEMVNLFDGPKAKYNQESWNIYPFYYSDGENYEVDNKECNRIMEEKILSAVNLFFYGHISEQGSQFQKMIFNLASINNKVRYADIPSRMKILDALRSLLGKKK